MEKSLFTLPSDSIELHNHWSPETHHKMELFGESFYPEAIYRIYVIPDTVAFDSFSPGL